MIKKNRIGDVFVKKGGVILILCLVVSLTTGCFNDRRQGGDNQAEVDPNEYPDFNTRGNVSLYVDYNYPGGCKALIELYAENPIELKNGTPTKKEHVAAIFKAFTDNDGTYKDTVVLPTAVSKVYVYTKVMGLPQCLEAVVENGAIHIDLSKTSMKGMAGMPAFDYSKAPYAIDQSRNLYSLFTWAEQGRFPAGYATRVSEVVNGDNREPLSKFTNRLTYTLWHKSDSKPGDLDNSQFVRGPEQTNVTIAHKAVDGTIITGARVDVTFVHEAAWNTNAFGYYYYDSNDKNPDLSKLAKYIIIPNVSIQGHYPYSGDYQSAPLESAGYKFNVQYFGADGKGKASAIFPPGYTIGWFVIPNGFDRDKNNINNNEYLYSNNNACITLYDKSSNKLVIGFEDGNSDSSYEDILFYVEADPMKAIIDPENPGKPSIDDEGNIDIVDETETISGTLAFEDIWPNGGDFDLNDLVVEYHRSITFDKENTVKKIEERFVQKYKGASFISAFATLYNSPIGGELTLPDGSVYEAATDAIIVYPNSELAKGKEFVVTRDFGAGSMKKSAMPAWNPFIIVNYPKDKDRRVEVHLPKHKATVLANQDLIGSSDDAFYVNKDKRYPFAIDIPIANWVYPSDMTRIDMFYPFFTQWTTTGQPADWYNRRK